MTIQRITKTSIDKTADIHLRQVKLEKGKHLILSGVCAKTNPEYIKEQWTKYAALMKRIIKNTNEAKAPSEKDDKEAKKMFVDLYSRFIIKEANTEEPIVEILEMLSDDQITKIMAFFDNEDEFQVDHFTRGDGIKRGKKSAKS